LKNQWSLLKDVRAVDPNQIEALAEVPVDSPWFSGHFPGEPILPGIALIYTVKQAITEEALKRNQKLHLHSLRRVRFTRPVRPGDTLSVSITAEDENDVMMFSFKIICKDNIVSSGFIAADKMK